MVEEFHTQQDDKPHPAGLADGSAEDRPSRMIDRLFTPIAARALALAGFALLFLDDGSPTRTVSVSWN
jgi:hypothetical protein